MRKGEIWSLEDILGCRVITGERPGKFKVLVNFRNGPTFRMDKGKVYRGNEVEKSIEKATICSSNKLL